MKNLLIFVNPKKQFHEEAAILIKIQIENSLDLGWKREDIILATNFGYEYNGVKSTLVSDESYYEYSPRNTKSNVVVELFKKGLIGDDLYWVHDLDVFQLEDISGVDTGTADVALCDYGRMPRLNFGSVFFKKSAEDIFDWIKEVKYQFRTNEEDALMTLITNNVYWANTPSRNIRGRFTPLDKPRTENIGSRIKKLNITYGLIAYNLSSVWPIVEKPLRVAHFHVLCRPENPEINKPSMVDFFVNGKNKLGIKLVPDRLAKILDKNGVV